MSGLDGLGWPNPEDEPKPTESMNDTPETDAAEFPCMTWPSRDHPMVIRAEVARKLERERDEARSEIIGWKNKWDCAIEMAARAECNLDEAREVLREIRDNEVNPEDEADKFLRDHLPSELIKVREQLTAVTEQRDKAWQKIENQAERITYLEGATNHATGTPLSKAIEQRDVAMQCHEWCRKDRKRIIKELTTVTAQRDRLIKSVEPLKYWRDISECDCSNPLPQGGCLRCDLNRILKTTNPNEL